ncbi:MAG: HAMP domain-containing histidine kinase [Gemmatimonadota bacterium]|nr:HAMP domain-containing histidine kinase [Gemmatimonadota bacterium]
MSLPFRHRVFLALVGLGTLPAAAALVVLAVQARSAGSPAGPGAALDEIAGSAGALIAAIDTTALDSAGRAALRDHATTIGERARLVHRAEFITRTAATALAVAIFLVAAVVVAASLILARRWARYVSAPVEELVEWVGRIERAESLPAAHRGGAPEFSALRDAMRQLAAALERVRRQEVEQARLTAFRETARRVAHEMRGPLSAARLALRQLPETSSSAAVEVLRDETARLERMATEFSEFGRLPEGPEALVDIAELVDGVLAGVTADQCTVTRNVEPGLTVRGHYEPLRRAVENLVRNALAFTDHRGIRVSAQRTAHTVAIAVRDHGPGVPDDMKDRIFEPYVTTRAGGTGLGLALVRQTVLAHEGTVTVTDAEGGGALFTVRLPERQ